MRAAATSAPDDPRPLDNETSLLIVTTVASTIRHFLLPYAAHFRGLGWRVDAAANGATEDPALRDAFDNLHEIPLSRSLLDVASLARGARKLSQIVDGGPTIVHAHTPIAAFVARAVVRRVPLRRRPALAYTAHGFHFHEGGNPVTNALYLAAERAAGRWTDRLVVINEEDLAAAHRYRIVPSRRLVRMPGIGIDTRAWSPSNVPADRPARVREQLRIGPDVPLFVAIGELTRNKRQGDAIAALASMRHANAHFIVLGEGPERAALTAAAADLGLDGRVHLPGSVPDVRPYVRAATAVVLSSRREGLARSVMEALALEVPVIASTARGNQELVGSDGGVIVPTGDIRALAGAMDLLIDDPETASTMGRRGRARIAERYDLDVVMRMHEDLYRGMIEERSRRVS